MENNLLHKKYSIFELNLYFSLLYIERYGSVVFLIIKYDIFGFDIIFFTLILIVLYFSIYLSGSLPIFISRSLNFFFHLFIFVIFAIKYIKNKKYYFLFKKTNYNCFKKLLINIILFRIEIKITHHSKISMFD